MKSITGALTKALSKQRRKFVANEIFERHRGIVQRGPYAGMALNGDANVSRGSLGLKILGLYEHPVVDFIASQKSFGDLINLGAADGYMALGPLYAKLCKRSICFELTETGRDAVTKNAVKNGLSENVIVRGKADDQIADQLKELDVVPETAMILCDIEGAEFDVLTSSTLEYLKGATLVIELHDRMMDEGTRLRDALIARLPEAASHKIIRLGAAIDFAGIEDLENLSDNDRALVMSEGRRVYGEWLVVEYTAA